MHSAPPILVSSDLINLLINIHHLLVIVPQLVTYLTGMLDTRLGENLTLELKRIQTLDTTSTGPSIFAAGSGANINRSACFDKEQYDGSPDPRAPPSCYSAATGALPHKNAGYGHGDGHSVS